MEVRLDELCLSEFIDIACGELGGLADKVGLPASSEEVKKLARSLCMEYRSIADPVGMKMYVGDHGGDAKDRAKMLLYSLAEFVVEHGDEKDIDEVRGLLSSVLGRGSVAKMDSDSLLNFVHKEERGVFFGMEKKKSKKGEAQTSDPKSVRDGFQREIAWMMSHYKMSIDTKVVSASVYAHLVCQAHDEVKRKLNSHR